MYPIVMCFVVAFGAMIASVASPDDAKRKETGVEIIARLDRQEVTPGDLVRLEELIPSTTKAAVTGVEHIALRIGRFDAKLGNLLNLNGHEFRAVYTDDEFDGLPATLANSHAMLFKIETPRQKGTEFEFRPKKLGIYLITVSWRIRNDDRTISSNPVVLVVKPPLDTNGKPIVKPEWLEKEHD